MPVPVIPPKVSTALPTPEIAPRLAMYFQAMTKQNASDLHLKVGAPPHIRVETGLHKSKKAEPLTTEDLENIVAHLLSPEQARQLSEEGGIDMAYQSEQGDRFRINIFRQRSELSIAVRRVTHAIPSFKALHLPESMAKITQAHQGLVLVAGPTGSGKSTTIASMLDYINETRASHIITIEDPIEYLYEDKMSLINQREIGIDVPSFDLALRAMLREDPDVVLIGEMRDVETMSAALQAAETGHLVFGTLHASTAPQALSRIFDMYPDSSRSTLQQSLAYNLHAIICQRLLPSTMQGVERVPAVEILISNALVREKLETGKDNEIADIIKGGKHDGMQTFTHSLYDLIQSDMIDPKVAYAISSNVVELKMMIKGIMQSQSGVSRRM